MPAAQLDLRGLAAQQPPSYRHVASVVDDAEAVHVLGPVPALAAVLTRLWKKERLPAVPVSWQPADDPASTGLARALELGSGSERDLPLVRDDHGGVLLAAGRMTAYGEQRKVLSRRFGAQAYCDDTRVANGEITRIDVRPDWTALDRISVAVVTLPLRPVQRATGRALQIASAPAQVLRDGVPLDREVTKWTWYADDRVRWRLRP